MFVILCLKFKKKERILPDEDERENLMHYNDPAGEVDNVNYDLSKLIPNLPGKVISNGECEWGYIFDG